MTTKPARSCESIDFLPSVLLGELARARRASARTVMIERTISTSGSTGTGLKKCMPEHALGLRGAGAELHDRHRRGVRGEELGVGQDLVELQEQLALGLLVLDDRLDRGVGALEVLERACV